MVEEKLSNKDTQKAETSTCDNVNRKRREPNKKKLIRDQQSSIKEFDGTSGILI